MYHSGKDYQDVDSMALRLRLDYCHLEKCLDVFKLAKQLNIVLIKYSSLNKEQLEQISKYDELTDGFTVFEKKNGSYKFYTYYNDSKGDARIRLTIAHEIKHVVFLEEDPDEKQEDLANHFARYLLAPTCLVMPYVRKNLSPLEIVSDFDISLEAAENSHYHAYRRIVGNRALLDDFEQEFMVEYLSKNKK